MTPALEAIHSDDLGGLFRFSTRGASSGVIEAGALTPYGLRGLMSPSTVNARDRAAFHAWAEAAIPGIGSRLRGVDQVHSAAVAEGESLRDGRRVEADGIVARSWEDAPVVMAADCAPVWIADPASGQIALVHAGWRGVDAGIVEAGVSTFDASRTQSRQLVAAVGPHLQSCCFEIGPEVAVRFEGYTRPASALVVDQQRADSVALDLASAIVARLRSHGVKIVHVAHACTRCRSDILHSYRRNGKGGPLMGAIASARVGAH